MTSEERRLVEALVGDGPRWGARREFGVVWAEVRGATTTERPMDRSGKKGKKVDQGKKGPVR